MTSSAVTTSSREDRQLAAQLADARTRLVTELQTADRMPEAIEVQFEHAVHRFADARIQSFVPILVERSVRAHFGQEGAVAAQIQP
jgi:hypothetical protein